MMKGQEIVLFSVNFSYNLDMLYRKYFSEPPGGADNVYVWGFKMTLTEEVGLAVDIC